MPKSRRNVQDQEEEWRPFGDYSVSSMGRVRRDKEGYGRWRHASPILSGYVKKCGYRYHSLVTDGARDERMTHTLVAEVFIGPRPEGLHVCHGNGDPLDNRLSNLRYDTPAGNTADAIQHGTFRPARTAALIESQVIEILQLLAGGVTPHVEIARRYGVGRTTITAIKTGRTWKWLHPNHQQSAAA